MCPLFHMSESGIARPIAYFSEFYEKCNSFFFEFKEDLRLR